MSRGPYGRLANVAKCAILLKYCINKIKHRFLIINLRIRGTKNYVQLGLFYKTYHFEATDRS